MTGILHKFPKHWDTQFQVSTLDQPQKEIMTGAEVLERVRNGTILKIALQILKSKRATATQEVIDQYKVKLLKFLDLVCM